MPEISVEDFALAVGTESSQLPEECREILQKTDFSYEVLSGSSLKAEIDSVNERIQSDSQIVGADERKSVWDSGWGENLDSFVKNNHNLSELIPRFIRPGQLIRWNQQFIQPANKNFELDFFNLLRVFLFEKYLAAYDPIYEFGCGTGFNLVELARRYPEKTLWGLDFVKSSCELVSKIGEAYDWNIKAKMFDMILPDESFELDRNGAVFTIGAVEQLAGRFEHFLQYLLKEKPALCLHVEPTLELYDEKNELDKLAMQFHCKRGYTRGYLPRLQELEKLGLVELTHVKRTYFGSRMMEGYSLIIWRPV